jgi:hypothetical protein
MPRPRAYRLRPLHADVADLPSVNKPEEDESSLVVPIVLTTVTA